MQHWKDIFLQSPCLLFLFGVQIEGNVGISGAAFDAYHVLISLIQADLVMDIAYSKPGSFLEGGADSIRDIFV